MQWTINGELREAEPDVRTTVLDLLREHLELTGTKKGCDHGQCGACTVLLNGRRVNSCLLLAVMHEGDSIVTVEGLGTADALHPLQRAFLTHDAFQCGYCTPGQLCSAAGMLDEAAKGWPSHASADLGAPGLNRAEIAERMSGNLCRCAAYPNIVDAISEVAGA
jgi:xanthine dehydrogenase YagT iron-sulfur-binding subunit